MPDVRRLAPWVIVAAALVYPLAVLAGGGPSFYTRDDCARPASEDAPIEAVFGRFESEWKARELLNAALGAGFVGTALARDRCGRVKVFLEDIPSLAVGRAFADQARSAGFEVRLEQAG